MWSYNTVSNEYKLLVLIRHSAVYSENRENEGTRSIQQSQFVSLPHTIRDLCASTNF